MKRGFLLGLCLALVAGAWADDASETESPLLVIDSQSVGGSGGTTTSDAFYLSRSVNFSVEVTKETGTANYDLIVQFQGDDGDGTYTWQDDPDGDLATAASADWSVYPVSVPYWTRQLRLKLTNDNGSAATYTAVIHRDSTRRARAW